MNCPYCHIDLPETPPEKSLCPHCHMALDTAAPSDETTESPTTTMLENPFTTTTDEIKNLWGETIPADNTPTMTIKSISASRLSQSRFNIKSYSFLKDEQGKGQYADYEIIKELGRGGIGVVHRARQTSVDRSIAVKMIKEQYAGRQEVHDKFLTEAAVTASLDHPNIVPIYDLGEDDDGHAFYTMKEVKGTPWNESITEKTLSENLSIFLRVCDAIAFSHNQHVIHLDLKPENIILGEFGEVLVMDWGSAASVVADSKAMHIKEMDSVVSSPAYMAPEMARISVNNIDIRSDIYQLGCILFEVLTGYAPHTGTSVLDCLRNAANNIIRPTDIEGELIEIAMKAMSTERNDRFQTVKELQEAINLYEEHHESLALTSLGRTHLHEAETALDYELFNQAIFAFRQAAEMWKNNRKALGGLSDARLAYAQCAYRKQDLDLGLSVLDPQNPAHAALCEQLKQAIHLRESRKAKILYLKNTAFGLGILICIILLTAFLWIREEQKKTEAALVMAQEEKIRAENEALRASAVSTFLADMLVQADPTGTGGLHITVLQLMEVMGQEVEQRSGDNPQTRHSLNSTIGRVYLGLGVYDKASRHLHTAEKLAEELYGRQSPEYVNDLNNLAEVYHKQGKLDESLPMFLEAERLNRAISQDDNATRGQILDNLAELYLLKGEYAKAREFYDKSLQIYKNISGEHSLSYAQSLHNLGDFHRQTGNYQDAEALYKNSLAIYDEYIGEQNASYAIGISNLAELYREQGQYSEAEPLYRKSLAILGTVLGESHPSYAACLNNLGNLYLLQADYPKAGSEFEKALAIYRQTLGENHPYYAITLSNLGSIYSTQYSFEKAENAYTEALRIYKNMFGEQHEYYATALHNLASLYFTSGQYEKAEPLFLEALEISGRIQGKNHPAYASGLMGLADLYRATGSYEKAENLCRNALGIYRESLGENNASYAAALINLGKILREQDKIDDAAQTLRQGMAIITQTLGDTHPYFAIGLINLAQIQLGKNDYAEAESLCGQSMEILSSIAGKTHPYYAASLYCLAMVFEKQGFKEKARPLLQNVLQIRTQTLGENHPETTAMQHKLAAYPESP